jgi:hypothetical protein
MKREAEFGTSLALSDEYIIVGEPGYITRPIEIGSVHVFDYDWNHVATLNAPEQGEYSGFGNQVATDGDIIVVGEFMATVDGHEKAGRAHIFDTGWNHLAVLQAPAPDDNGEFGIDLAVGGGLVVVGEGKGDVSDMNEGKTYLFDLEGNLISTLTSPDPTIGARFGYRVATDGEFVVVAEVEATADELIKAGRVHIFQAGAAVFISGNLTIDPSSVEADGTVTVSVEVKNTGSESGSHTVALKLDGEVEEEKTVTLSPEEAETVSFEVTTSKLGTHSVEIDGLTGSYAVTEKEEEPSGGIPGFPYEAIILGVVAGVVILWMMQRGSDSSPYFISKWSALAHG